MIGHPWLDCRQQIRSKQYHQVLWRESQLILADSIHSLILILVIIFYKICFSLQPHTLKIKIIKVNKKNIGSLPIGISKVIFG